MLSKNQIYSAKIESLSSDGSGVCHIEGMTVFVPFSAPEDVAEIKIVKVKKTFAFGIIHKLTEPSPCRIVPDCPAFGKCGGCKYRHISYSRELLEKQMTVENALRRIGGLDIKVSRILCSGETDRYRNKVQFPVLGNPPRHGLYAPRSHRIVSCEDCLLQPSLLNSIAKESCRILGTLSATGYDEATLSGDIRHIFVRKGEQSGEIMLCLVINAPSLPFEKEFAAEITGLFPQITTVCVNSNTDDTNVILGAHTRTLFGNETLSDSLCGVPVSLSPHSFYQVNHKGAELLYGEVKRLCGLTGAETVLDLYCGSGTIGLSLAGGFGRLIGCETVPAAIESAKKAAEKMGLSNTEFIAGDAGKIADLLAKRGEKPHIVITDPPRSGCDALTLESIIKMSPQKVVMVSCDPATCARDVKYLCEHGYTPIEATAVDLFPRTEHMETVVLLCRQ